MPTPIGNLEDLTFRALDRLKNAEVFFCEDTRVTKKLLNLISTRFQIDFKKDSTFISFHSHNEDEILASLDQDIFVKNCVFVSDAGMPCISDPGAKLANYLIRHNINYEVLAGANAAIVAYAKSGETSSRFVFYGFLPHKEKSRIEELKRLLSLDFAVILYESPLRITQLISEIKEFDKTRLLHATKELTKLYEKSFFGTPDQVLDQLKASSTKGEWCVVIFPSDRAVVYDDQLIGEIKNLQAPPKPLAKVLAKMTDRSVTDWYDELNKKEKR